MKRAESWRELNMYDRRGGPACHKLYGKPIAINAGCAGYFMAMHPFQVFFDLFGLQSLSFSSSFSLFSPICIFANRFLLQWQNHKFLKELTDTQKLYIYDQYFGALRACKSISLLQSIISFPFIYPLLS